MGRLSPICFQGDHHGRWNAGSQLLARSPYSAVDSTTWSRYLFHSSPGKDCLYQRSAVVAGGPTTPYLPSLALAKEIEPGQLWPELLRRPDDRRYGSARLCGGRTLASPTSSICQKAPSNLLRPPLPTMTMPTVQCTASSRCGNRRIATRHTPPPTIPRLLE